MTILIIPVAIVFALLGIAALASPRHVLAPLELDVATPTARTEVRAVYGGLSIAVAAVLLASLGLPAGDARGVLLAGAVLSLGMSGGRLFGWLLEPVRAPVTWALLALEAGGGAALLLAR